jgi:hypothetical protein
VQRAVARELDRRQDFSWRSSVYDDSRIRSGPRSGF